MKKLLMLVMLFMFTSCGFEIVDAGHRGVRVNMGKVEKDSLPEGLHFYNPLTSDVKEIDVRQQTFEIESSSYTKDLQQAKIKMSVVASPTADQVHYIYQTLGEGWDEKILFPMVIGTTKSVIGKWEADRLVGSREEARSEIENTVKTELAKKMIQIYRIELTDIEYTLEYEQAIEEKVKSIQRAQQKENEKREAIADAQKAIEQQRGVSESQIIAATAEAKSTIVKAEAQARANRLLAESISPILIEYRKIDVWDGKLPKVSGANTLISIPLK